MNFERLQNNSKFHEFCEAYTPSHIMGTIDLMNGLYSVLVDKGCVGFKIIYESCGTSRPLIVRMTLDYFLKFGKYPIFRSNSYDLNHKIPANAKPRMIETLTFIKEWSASELCPTYTTTNDFNLFKSGRCDIHILDGGVFRKLETETGIVWIDSKVNETVPIISSIIQRKINRILDFGNNTKESRLSLYEGFLELLGE